MKYNGHNLGVSAIRARHSVQIFPGICASDYLPPGVGVTFTARVLGLVLRKSEETFLSFYDQL